MTGITPKLTVELVPASMWGANLRVILNKKTWDCIRRNVYAAADHKCEVCNLTGPEGRVECHEKWEFDDAHSVQKLVGLLCLCPICHRAKHIGRLLSVHGVSSELMTVLGKLRFINGWSNSQCGEHISAALAQFEERSQREWTLDITWLESHKEILG